MSLLGELVGLGRDLIGALRKLGPHKRVNVKPLPPRVCTCDRCMGVRSRKAAEGDTQAFRHDGGKSGRHRG